MEKTTAGGVLLGREGMIRSLVWDTLNPSTDVQLALGDWSLRSREAHCGDRILGLWV